MSSPQNNYSSSLYEGHATLLLDPGYAHHSTLGPAFSMGWAPAPSEYLASPSEESSTSSDDFDYHSSDATSSPVLPTLQSKCKPTSKYQRKPKKVKSSLSDSLRDPPSRPSRSRPKDHIPRPRNAFFIFRTEFCAEEILSAKVEHHHSHVSRIIGLVWKAMSPEEKYPYKLRATQEKIEHMRKYPEYHFTPKPRTTQPVKRKVKRNSKADLLRDQFVAQQIAAGKSGDELEVAVNQHFESPARVTSLKLEKTKKTKKTRGQSKTSSAVDTLPSKGPILQGSEPANDIPENVPPFYSPLLPPTPLPMPFPSTASFVNVNEMALDTSDYSPPLIDSDPTFDLGLSQLQLSDDTVPNVPPTYPHQYHTQPYDTIPPQYLASAESCGHVDPSLIWNGTVSQPSGTLSELMFALEPRTLYPSSSGSLQYYSPSTILIPPYASYDYSSGASSSSSDSSFSFSTPNLVNDFSFSNYVHDQWN